MSGDYEAMSHESSGICWCGPNNHGPERRPAFRAVDRIIYAGRFIGTLLEETTGLHIAGAPPATGQHWTVDWEDGGGHPQTVYPAADMVHANGGPSSAHAAARRRHPEAQELHQIIGSMLQTLKHGGNYDLLVSYEEDLTRALELAAIYVSDTEGQR